MQLIMIFGDDHPQHRRRLHRSGPPRATRPTGGDAPAASQPVQSTSKVHDSRRRRSKQIADGTIDTLQKGFYDEHVPHSNQTIRHDISGDLRHTERHTVFYPEDSFELSRWQTAFSSQRQATRPAKLSVLPLSTLEGARYMDNITSPSSPKHIIGILNFASATKPGGGFLTGAVAQEESIARSSSLYLSLATPIANRFYASHIQDNKGGFYTHAMVYSPNVLLIRSDDGAWLNPLKVDVVTSPAVNAKEVRERRRAENQSIGGLFGNTRLDAHIREVMRERMARILALFELRGVKNIVLGSFGTGVFQNDIRVVAGIWSELLKGRQARFSTSFDNVLFAIPDQKTLDEFKDGLGPLRNLL